MTNAIRRIILGIVALLFVSGLGDITILGGIIMFCRFFSIILEFTYINLSFSEEI